MILKETKKCKHIKTRVGFGTGAGRFAFTSHPKLDTNGVYHETCLANDPALYHPKNIDEIYKVNRSSKKEPWRCKTELEDWCANLGYRNQNVLTERSRQATFLGPAWHDISKPTKCISPCHNMSFGRTSRFQKSDRSCTPAPGTYYKTKPYKAPYGSHTSKPSFEWGPPCRFKDTTVNWKPDPCRYHIIDRDSIEMLSKKVVSLLGPYQLFTVARDLSTIVSKTNISKVKSAKTWPLNLPGCFERFKKSSYGKFNRTNMLVPYRGRNALNDLSMRIPKEGEPGPGSYDVLTKKKVTQCKYAFNSSISRPRGSKRTEVWPGVGRYHIKVKNCGIFGQGHCHVFKSNISRTVGGYPPQQYNDF